MSIKARLAIVLVVLILISGGVFVAFLLTGGSEILFGPTVPVTFSTIDGQPDMRRVILTGKLDLPSSEAMGEDFQFVYLTDPTNAEHVVWVKVNVPQYPATLAPNQMSDLPVQYTYDDLRVRLADGSYVGWDDVVRVTGRIRQCTSGTQHNTCMEAELIEAAD